MDCLGLFNFDLFTYCVMSTDRCMRLKRQPVMITISRRRKLFKQFQAARCQKAPKTGRCVHSHLRRLFADEGVGG